MQPRPFQSLLPFPCLSLICHLCCRLSRNCFSGGCLQFNHAAKTCSNLHKKTKKYFWITKKKMLGPMAVVEFLCCCFLAIKNIYLLLGIAVIDWNLSCIGHEFYNIISDLNSSVSLFCLILKNKSSMVYNAKIYLVYF